MTVSGNLFDYLFAFLGGIVVSFTPCVYPLIPVTIAYIGIKSSGSKIKGFSLSLAYVTGIAFTYSLLGLAASLSGKLFGSFILNPVVYFLSGGIVILFGLSLFDLFTLPIPHTFKLPVFEKQNYFSVFLLGLVNGLIVSPCVTPMVGSILAYLATKKNLFYGTALLFVFAYGMGFILILAGTFGSLLLNLPKSGRWMVFLKKISAFVLLGMGLYFIYRGIIGL